MTTSDPSTPAPRPSRRFGAATLAAAALAAAVLAAGGTWLLARPDRHDHGAEGAAAAKAQWQCPMHPTIVQDHPGDCPICGMKLVKLDVAAPSGAPGGAAPTAAAKDQWQCPMHPSIVQDHPGDCPICGMKLVKAAAATPAAGAGGTAPAAQAPAKWQCPMHPTVVQDHPGDCPICGMKLVQVASGDQAQVPGSTPEGLAAVTIDAARQQLIGLKIAHVERGAVGAAWRAPGRVAIDETRVHHVNVKFSGFMEHVHGDFVGRPVRKGQPLFSIYSPELLAAQDELILALRTRSSLGEHGGLAADGDALVAAARRKLELWDVPAAEIERIERTGRTSRTVTFTSPATGVITKKDVVPGMKVSAGDMPFEIVDLSRVWVLADAYESDLARVKLGTPATVMLKAFPNRSFAGRVAFVDPLLDPKTRTAKVRIEVPNPNGDLRPEMFGEVTLRGAARAGLRVPADAIIHSGTQNVVFVALPDGKFLPREVQVGEGDGQFVEILSGLEPGDGVVTRANFLVDSESRLRASLAALATPAQQAAPAGGAAPPQGGPGGSGSAAPDPHAGHGR